MFSSYFKTAIRNILRQRGLALVNLVGLSVGLASGILIYQYVSSEARYDRFHADADRIYRVAFDRIRDGREPTHAATNYAAVGPVMTAEYPEVEAFARITTRYGGGVVRRADRAFKETAVFHADASFLTLFDYPLLQGERATALAQPNSAVVSTDAALRLFGSLDVLGETFRFGDAEEYVVTGVAESPANSHIRFDYLFSYQTLEELWEMDMATSWANIDFMTYVRLADGADSRHLEARLPELIRRNVDPRPGTEVSFTLQPLTSIHLESDRLFEASANGDANAIRALALIALFIVIIAWINYVNLATSRSIERAREIGVRKVVGARKAQLVTQFMFESVTFNLVALGGAIVLAVAAAGPMSDLTGQSITPAALANPVAAGILAAIILLGTLVSGLYPAFVLSSFKPISTLKGRFESARSGMLVRKALVTTQFVATIGLVAATVVVSLQVAHMRSQDIGVDVSQVVVFDAPGVVLDNAGYHAVFESFKQALKAHPGIERAAASSEVPGSGDQWLNNFALVGSDAGASSVYTVAVDFDYLETYDHRLVAGRFLSPDFPADSSRVVLNELAAGVLGFSDPSDVLGERVSIFGDTLTVAGVVADHNQLGLDAARYQIAYRIFPDEYRYFSAELAPGQIDVALRHIEDTYTAFFPSYPFEARFADELFDRQYTQFHTFRRIVTVFAGLALIVACLGLFGLASYAASQRTREIGIRKVFGARVSDILLLLNGEFARLLIVATIAATSLGYFLLQQWLDGFAYRIDLTLWPFLLAGLLTGLLALATVSSQSMRVARLNPVDSIS